MRLLYIVSAISLVTLVGGGCLSSKSLADRVVEKVVEKRMADEGVDGSFDIEDGNVTFTDDETGATGTFGTDIGLGDFPKDVPVPSGVTVMGVANSPDGAWVSYTTTQSAADLGAWYESELTAQGWTKQGYYLMGTASTWAYKKDTVSIGLIITDATDGNPTSVMVTRAEE